MSTVTLISLVVSVIIVAVTTASASQLTYPKPHLSVYGHYYSPFYYTNQALTFDASSSFLPNSTALYYLYFQFGEYDFGKKALAHALVGPVSLDSDLAVTYAYTKPGMKLVNVTVSDTPFFPKSSLANLKIPNSLWINSSYTGKLASNLPAPFYSIEIFVKRGDPDCARIESKLTSYSNTSIVALQFKATSLNQMNQRETSELTRGFQNLGGSIMITLKNSSASQKLPVHLDHENGLWSSEVSSHFLESSTDVYLKVDANSVLFGSCRISSGLEVLNHFPPSKYQWFGYRWPNLQSRKSMIESISNGSIRVDAFQLVRHSCFSGIVFGTFGAYNVSNQKNTGAYLLYSTDGMTETQVIVDLTRNAKGEQSLDSNTICIGLSSNECDSLQIYTLTAVANVIIFLTNFGIVSFDLVEHKSKRVELPIADSLAKVQDFWKMAKLSITTTCFQNEPITVSLIYSSKLSLIRDSIIISPLNQFLMGKVQLGLTTADVVGTETTQLSFIEMTRQSNLNTNVYLLGVPKFTSDDLSFSSYNGTVLYSQTFQDRDRIAPYNSWPKCRKEYTFDPAFEAVGMSYHQSWMDLIVFGDSVYQSSGIGGFFQKVKSKFQLGDEYVVKFYSVHGSPKYFLGTNKNRILYGNIVGNELVQLISMSPNHQDKRSFHQAYVDNAGRLSQMTLSRTFPGNWVKKITIPIGSYLATVDYASDLDVALKPKVLGKSHLSFEAFQKHTVTGVLVQGSHVLCAPLEGSTVEAANRRFKLDENAQSTGGCIYDPYVPHPYNAFNCPLISNFPQELVLESPALLSDLTISDFSVSAISMSDSVNLSLDLKGPVGWLKSDIGKTIVLNSQSFLIHTIVNGSTAKAFFSGHIYLNKTSQSVKSGHWTMLDFRAFREEAMVLDQQLTITAVAGGDGKEFLATLSTGFMNFTDYHDGMFLTFYDTHFGTIEGIISETQVRVRGFSDIPLSVYSFGDWSLFRVTSHYEYGRYPRDADKMKGWKMSMRPCYVDSFERSSENNALFMERNLELMLRVSLRLSEEQIRSESKSLYTSVERNALVHARNTKRTVFDGTLLSINSMILMKEGGLRGRSAINFKTNSYSLTCPMEIPILHIFVECNPVSELVIDKFNINNVTDGKTVKQQEFPVNYRPPSHLGRHIPTSANLYNVDPMVSRYRDFFQVSKSTGSYGHCAGKSQKSECQCTKEMQLSQLQRDSDCLNKATIVHYSVPLIPNIKLYVGNGIYSSSYKYQLVELNNRTDYCANDISDCQNVEMVKGHVYNPETGIIWHGSELYHFRVELIDGSFCYLEDEFMVWVDQPPLAVNISELSLAGSTAIFGITILFIYLGWAFLK